MRENAAPVLHQHKVSPQSKGRDGRFGRIWAQMWSITSIDARPLLLGFAMCAGAALYFSLPFEPTLAAAGTCFGGAMLLLVMSSRLIRFAFIYTGCIILAGVSVGVLAGTLRSLRVAQPVIAHETRPVMLEGWVSQIEPGTKGARVRIDVHAIAGMSASETPRFVRVTHRRRLEVFPGRFVRCWVVLRPPPAPSLAGDYVFQRQAWFQGLGGVGYVQGRCTGGALGVPKPGCGVRPWRPCASDP